jgi:hypothetical protein
MCCQCTLANVHHANKFLEKLEGNDYKASMETRGFLGGVQFCGIKILVNFSN